MNNAYQFQPEIIAKYGYPVEVHNITTQDGYILQAHRIPYGKSCGPAEGKRVIWLQHGLLGDSSNWIINGVGKGLGDFHPHLSLRFECIPFLKF
jgi:lysosomal acid lipase/cholesteryl ester hydrolase